MTILGSVHILRHDVRGVGGPDTDDDFDDAGGRVQNWPKVDDVICACSLICFTMFEAIF